MNIEIWMAFVLAAGANIISPGPAIVLAIRNGLSLGIGYTFYSTIGNVLAIGVVGVAVSFGLGTLMVEEPRALLVMRILGGSFLIWMAYQSWQKGMISLDKLQLNSNSTTENLQRNTSRLTLFRQAFVVGITNPKMLVFLLALFPIFLRQEHPLGQQFMVMTLTFMGISFLSLSVFSMAAVKFSQLIQREFVIQVLNKLIACIFFGFGISLYFGVGLE